MIIQSLIMVESFKYIKDEYRISYTRAVVEVQEWIDGTIHIFYKDKELKIKEVKRENIDLKEEDKLEILRKKEV